LTDLRVTGLSRIDHRVIDHRATGLKVTDPRAQDQVPDRQVAAKGADAPRAETAPPRVRISVPPGLLGPKMRAVNHGRQEIDPEMTGTETRKPAIIKGAPPEHHERERQG
jgi:hypothetical protein